MAPERPRITKYSIERYRAFEHAEVALGRITILLGRNNAGKSALCFAPLYFAQAFRADAHTPLVSSADPLMMGSPQSAFHRRAATGAMVRFHLEDAVGIRSVALGVTVNAELRNRQVVTLFKTEEEHNPISLSIAHKPDWSMVKSEISARPGLRSLADEVAGLRGVRPLPPSEYPYLGYAPTGVGFHGEFAPSMLLEAGDDGLEAINGWYRRLHVSIDIRRDNDTFEIVAEGASGEPVNLSASGAGIAQLLPFLVQLELAKHMPRLWCIEQPELHLHPGAHSLVAEALLRRVCSDTSQNFLVETHSDAFVLRIRRAIAEEALTPQDVRIYFVDEQGDQTTGSSVQEIPLDDEGTPKWWPRGVFAEPETEYFAIRRALARRGGMPS